MTGAVVTISPHNLGREADCGCSYAYTQEVLLVVQLACRNKVGDTCAHSIVIKHPAKTSRCQAVAAHDLNTHTICTPGRVDWEAKNPARS